MTTLTMSHADFLARIDAIKSLFGTDCEVVFNDESPPFHLAEKLHEPPHSAPYFSCHIEGIPCVIQVVWDLPEGETPSTWMHKVGRDVLTRLPTTALHDAWRDHLVNLARELKVNATYHRQSAESAEATADNILTMLNNTTTMAPTANGAIH